VESKAKEDDFPVWDIRVQVECSVFGEALWLCCLMPYRVNIRVDLNQPLAIAQDGYGLSFIY